jgi:hypothetical protein
LSSLGKSGFFSSLQGAKGAKAIDAAPIAAAAGERAA